MNVERLSSDSTQAYIEGCYGSTGPLQHMRGNRQGNPFGRTTSKHSPTPSEVQLPGASRCLYVSDEDCRTLK